MSLIICSECGKEISEKAMSCPHCGNPIAPMPPVPPAQHPPVASPNSRQGVSPSAPNVGIDTQKLKCPYCGEVLGPKDIMSSGWAKCPTCGETIRLTGANGEYDDNVLIERLIPFAISKDTYHKVFMQRIMSDCGENIFEKMRLVSIKRKYFWVREFGKGNDRVIYPMCDYGKQLFQEMTSQAPWLTMEEYEQFFPTANMVPFNSEDIIDTEIVPKQLSASEVNHEFSHTEVGNLAPTPNYYCIPVMEEVVEMDGREYTFIGTAGDTHYWFSCDIDFVKTPMPEPKYTKMRPVSITFWVIIIGIILAILIPCLIKAFWTTVIFVGILAIFHRIIAGLVMVINAFPHGIDIIICKAVNSRRRKAFRQKYAALQEAKKQSAKQRMNVELTYDVPEFPIP